MATVAQIEYVKAILYWKHPVGMDSYKICMEIIKAHPEEFPWFAKYNSIPEEVHKAYNKEANAPFLQIIEEWKTTIPNAEQKTGLVPFIENSGTVMGPLTLKHLEDFIQNMDEQDGKRMEAEKKDEALWDKHYSKYGLPYNEKRRQF